MSLNVLSLFTGIGGIELGLEAAGMTTVGQVEWDEYCQKVLTRHWPDVARHDDVSTAVEWWQSQPRPRVDVVCGGFPCQPFSLAGKQLGVNDERWMWPETATVIRAVQPRYALLENVSALVRDSWAFGTVLSDLHTLGFDAEWATLRASDFGAPHGRERVYILAYPKGEHGITRDRLVKSGERGPSLTTGGLSGLAVHQRRERARQWLASEPRVDRLADGIPNQSHRLRCAGNAVVPAVAEHIGNLIVRHATALEVAA
jgi:DNA (cytosine-5)-methyltransferase 1